MWPSKANMSLSHSLIYLHHVTHLLKSGTSKSHKSILIVFLTEISVVGEKLPAKAPGPDMTKDSL